MRTSRAARFFEMPMKTTVAVTQMNCRLGDVQANLGRMNDLARRISRKEVDVVCYPELVTTGYSLGQKWVELAETVPGPTTDKLGQTAREFGFHLIAGISERDSESDRIFNSAVLINSEGKVAGVHRKIGGGFRVCFHW